MCCKHPCRSEQHHQPHTRVQTARQLGYLSSTTVRNLRKCHQRVRRRAEPVNRRPVVVCLCRVQGRRNHLVRKQQNHHAARQRHVRSSRQRDRPGRSITPLPAEPPCISTPNSYVACFRNGGPSVR